MKQERRTFTRDFKLNAVELSYLRGNVVELANYQGKSFSGNGKPKITVEESEVFRLKKELVEVRIERDILKKAVGIFSKSDGKFTGLLLITAIGLSLK
ncbi:MAG: transposase [Labilibaculum sp.]|nr:transposase [Labilibaculum sp.]